MAIYVKIVDSKVVKSIVAESSFFDNFTDTSPGEWLETFEDANGEAEKRYNYAGVGSNYSKEHDAFWNDCKFPSWTINTDTFEWEPPTEKPNDGNIYFWNEETQAWVQAWDVVE